MSRIKWFSDARFGLFIHWGLYSVLGRGEWVMCRERISAEEYAKLVERFHPEQFEMDSLCRFAVQCGMKYAVFTTCHHEGFAMFDSRADAFCSMNAPARRDFVAEFTAACRKYGLKIGLYYSLGDWRFGIMKESDSAEKAERMRDLTYDRVRELMTNYGKIDLLWYDGGWCYPSTPQDTWEDVARFWRAEKLNAMVRSLQPDILINNRSGTPEDFCTPEGELGSSSATACEACFTLGADTNSHWGYFKNERVRKTTEQLLSLVVSSITRGQNLLLNVGPDANGIIPAWQRERLEEVGGWIQRNSEAAFFSGCSDATRDCNGTSGNEYCRIAENPEAVYCYFQDYPEKETFIPVMKPEIVKAEFLNSPSPLVCLKKDRGVLLRGFPDVPPDSLCTVVKLTKKKA